MHYQITTSWAIVLGILAVWDIVWRGLALWRAAQHRSRNWFIVLLVINSVGILPIIYIYNTKPAVRKH